MDKYIDIQYICIYQKLYLFISVFLYPSKKHNTNSPILYVQIYQDQNHLFPGSPNHAGERYRSGSSSIESLMCKRFPHVTAGTQKLRFGRWCSFSIRGFWGSMLIFWDVPPFLWGGNGSCMWGVATLVGWLVWKKKQYSLTKRQQCVTPSKNSSTIHKSTEKNGGYPPWPNNPSHFCHSCHFCKLNTTSDSSQPFSQASHPPFSTAPPPSAWDPPPRR